MTFTELKKRAGKELNLLDSSLAFLSGRDISESQIEDSINDAYLHDVVGALAEQYPFLYEVEAYAPNYTYSSTVSSVTTTTLIISDAYFVTGHEGCNIYNADKEKCEQIETYASTTQATMAASVADWEAGDTVYILDRDYTFGGDASDYIENLSVWVRYGDDGTYIPATMKLHDDLFQTGYETFDQSDPKYILKTFSVSDVPTNGFSLYPLFEENDSKAVKMRYLQMPTALSATTDVPKLPLNHQSFLYWKAVEEGAIARKDTGLAQYAQQKYEQGRARLLASFKPLRNLKPKRDIQAHLKNIKNREY